MIVSLALSISLIVSAHGAGDYFAAKFLFEFLKNNTFENAISVANKKTAEFISA